MILTPFIRCWRCKGNRPATDEDCLYCGRPAIPPTAPAPGTCYVCGGKARYVYTCQSCQRPDAPPRAVDMRRFA